MGDDGLIVHGRTVGDADEQLREARARAVLSVDRLLLEVRLVRTPERVEDVKRAWETAKTDMNSLLTLIWGSRS